LTFQLPGQDIHASPFRFSLNLSRDVPSLVPLVGTSGTVEVSGLAFAVDGSVTPIPASSMIFSNPSPTPPPTGPNLTVAHPDVCSTAGPDCIFTVAADVALKVRGVTIRFFIGAGTHEFKFSLPDQDLHASPFKFLLNLLASGLAPPFGQTVPVQLVALTENMDGTATFSATYKLLFTNPISFSTSTPPTCRSDLPCSFAIRSSAHLGVKGYTLTVKNKATGVQIIAASADFGTTPGGDLFSGITPSVVFNNIDIGGTIVPPCGGSVTLSTNWLLFLLDGSNVQVPGGDFVLTSGNCTAVEFHGIRTTQDVIGPCVGVKGSLGIEGKLDFVTAIGGLLQTFNNQPVHVGLIDPATNKYYEYAVVQTDDAGNFSTGFGVANHADVAQLVPPTGSKDMKFVAAYNGDDTHSPAQFSKNITLLGEQNTKTCITGVSIAKQIFNTVPADVTEVHQLVQAFTTSIIPSQVAAQAQSMIQTVHDAIVKSGAVPVDVEVFQGPGIPLVSFYGLGAINVPSIIVVSHAYGSPVAAAVIILAIIGALIVLGIVVYFIVQAFTDLIVKGGKAGATTAILLALGFLGVVGLGGYLLMRSGGFRKAAAKSVKGALS